MHLPHIKPGARKSLDSTAAAGVFVRRHSHRLKNTLIGILVVLVVFALSGFFIVPPVVKHYLVKISSEQLGREVAIQKVDVNPFTMRVRVQGFSMKEPRSSQEFVAFEALTLTLEYRSLLRLAPVLNHIVLTKPYVHIVRNAGGRTYNFSDLIDKFSKPTPKQETKNPSRFSLNNIRLVNGRIDFEDQPKAMRHAVSELEIAIPFISNLPDAVDLYVQPAFSARVNGTYVALTGRTKPFKDTLETSIEVNIKQLELPRYMEYVPLKLDFKLTSGLVNTRLTASFVRATTKKPLLMLKGEIGVERLGLSEPGGKPLLNLAGITVPVTSVDVFDRKIVLGNIAITSPEVFVRRNREGLLNWLTVRPQTDPNTAQDKGRDGAPSVTLSVAEVAVHDGVVHVDDEAPAKAFREELFGVQATLRQFTVPQTTPAQVEVAFKTNLDETVKLAATLLLDPLTSEGTAEVSKVKLKNYQPYYQHLILYNIEDGSADLSTRYRLRNETGGAQLRLSELNLLLSSVRMRKAAEQEDLLRAKSVQIRNAEMDLSKLVLTMDQVTMRDGVLNIIREADGGINVARILPASKEVATHGRQSTPWLVTLQHADADKWKIAFTDLTAKGPVKLVADRIRFIANGISNRKGAKGQISLRAKINDTGVLKVAGPLTINPLAAELNLEVERVPLVPLQPYFTDKVSVLLSSADLSVKGTTSLTLPASGMVNVRFTGEASLADLASVDKTNSEELLKWKSLFLSGIQYQHIPMALSIDQVALSDFYARIIVLPEGRLNLQNIMAKGEHAEPVEGREKSSSPTRADTTGTAGPKQTPAAAAPASAQPRPPVSIRIAKVTLQGGDVAFTDLFIKPNYSADLSEIGGSVTGLSSQLDTTADVELRGRFAKAAPVVIKGKVNPLISDLFLDLAANVRDIELGPLTPYAGKYVGYAIEKGKLSFDVAYKIDHRKLTATNRLVLNQLTFGGKIESPQATKLPVLLAVSLLKDRNGVIDVNLPISGSLDDPKFRIGGIILHIIFNLIEKAVTAPFALIGNLIGGGGGEELSYVEFDYGRATPSDAAQEKLTKLQRALMERPGLKMDITGRADPDKDREGLRQYRFEQQVKAQKLKDLVKKGTAVPSVDQVKVDPSEYEKYLRRAYKEAKFAKPRNALGFTKDLPVAETEKLMLLSVEVSDDDLVKLANQRAQFAKEAITKEEKVAPQRVYLLAPKIDALKTDDKRKGSRVDFALK